MITIIYGNEITLYLKVTPIYFLCTGEILQYHIKCGLMEMTRLIQPLENHEKGDRMIREIAVRLSAARTKSELLLILVHEMQHYTIFDLQIIGGRLNNEIDYLPSPTGNGSVPISVNSCSESITSSLPCTAAGHLQV